MLWNMQKERVLALNDFYMLQDLDRYITGNYGEDEYDYWVEELEDEGEDDE